MKKAKKFLVGLLCIVNAMLGAFSLTACKKEGSSSDTCEHDYAWYSVTEATCAKKGEMEGICQTCGEKTTLKVEKKEHYWINGACITCNQKKSDVESQEPLAENIGWTVEKIEAKAKSMGYNIKLEDYIGYTLKNPVINTFGKLCYKVEGLRKEDTVTLFDVREDFEVSVNSALFTIEEIKMQRDSFRVTTVDGETRHFYDYGALKQFLPEENALMGIEKIAVDKNNVVVVVYATGKWEAIGKLASA